jgi:AcrR family transcriptional regulator
VFAAVKPARKRLAAADRRRQIVRVASALLASHGVEHVRMPEVAEAAGVTRAVVYRFFPSRKALLTAVLLDFEEELLSRFRQRVELLEDGRNVETAIRGFGEASCEAVDAAGPGGWLLLNMDGPDPELADVVRSTREALHRPWLARVARFTRAGEPTATIVSGMAVAMSRAALSLYISGAVTRERAVDSLGRGVRALLEEFRR